MKRTLGMVPSAPAEAVTSVLSIHSSSFSFSYCIMVPPLTIVLKIKLGCKSRLIIMKKRVEEQQALPEGKGGVTSAELKIVF